MNGRERVLAALNRQEPDRVPFDLGSTQVTGIHAVAYRALRDRLGLPPVTPTLCDDVQGLALPDDDLLDRLGVDVRGLFPLNSHNDRVAERIRREPKGDPTGTQSAGEEVEAFVDEWGITQHRPYPDGLYFTAVRHPLEGEISVDGCGEVPLAGHGRPAPHRRAARPGRHLPGRWPGGDDQGGAGRHLRDGAAHARHGAAHDGHGLGRGVGRRAA